ncbi:MAG: type II toxin-antitoxin system prevent-host-death family antitoxin [Kiritimatiellia bacterium]|nr:type II toxin-antitoxin system prevent-host-death family antitoxin [Planctomycetota bacterium]MDP6630772.1 type II toxin-antitoxin system prevent-host-death family antitoxin [Kiritimatiellia bacterium]MDP6809364.1 type II toxin-antitoxin system prevent-host-death family antitoxin [Kiritimatiellia bacterium]MDP7023958.1 type II toxin-antitoxin system prevent-host-death family antitoxin [Kiritimatiellia bacterium]
MNKGDAEQANVAMVKEHLSAYLTKAERGESTTVCRRNRPVARIVPVKSLPSSNHTRLGSAQGSVIVKCDLTAPAMDASDWSMLG